MRPTDNDHAFPVPLPGYADAGFLGTTLRDYFAAKAMQAMITGNGTRRVADTDARFDGNNIGEIIAINAYEFADAMLEARKRTGE